MQRKRPTVNLQLSISIVTLSLSMEAMLLWVMLIIGLTLMKPLAIKLCIRWRSDNHFFRPPQESSSGILEKPGRDRLSGFSFCLAQVSGLEPQSQPSRNGRLHSALGVF